MSEPQHGFQMAPQHRRRNQLGNFCRLIAATLDLVQRRRSATSSALRFSSSLPLVVPLRSARVEIPAVVIDPLSRSRFSFFEQHLANVGQRFAFQMQKSHHHIGHLHAGVVDVVLHIDFLPGGAQQAHKRVAQNGVAQVADVRGLVGIDAGVLDQRMNRGLPQRSPALATCGS